MIPYTIINYALVISPLIIIMGCLLVVIFKELRHSKLVAFMEIIIGIGTLSLLLTCTCLGLFNIVNMNR